jgi:phosphonate degradation associated HDIG domain protein
MKLSKLPLVEQIRRLFAERGDSMYAGEPVTQTEHALQCATLAESVSATAALITAALLHDIGHLLHDFDEDCAQEGVDDRHEQLGAKWLESWFGPDVCEPVKLHVPAKRYRCAMDRDYQSKLSAASKLSLRLQGGPMKGAELTAFRENPYCQHALQLRNWDDTAKQPDLETPTLSHFLTYAETASR